MLINYTTYDSVRAVLGMSSRELPDTVLADEVYSLALHAELTAVGHAVSSAANLVQDYSNLIPPLSSVDQNFYSAVRLFSAHAVAFKALSALPELSPIYISDSKAALKKDLSMVVDRVVGEFTKYRRALIVAYASYLGLPAPPVFQPSLMKVSSPDFDPVTGG